MRPADRSRPARPARPQPAHARVRVGTRRPAAWRERLPQVVLAGVGVVALATAAGLLLDLTGIPGTDPAPRLASAGAEVVGETGERGEVAAVEQDGASSEPVATAPTGPGPVPGTGTDEERTARWARALLASWDRAREQAWVTGDADAVRALYAAGSSAGVRDAELLQRWTASGVVVEAVRLRVDDLEVLSLDRRRVVVSVTDRLRVRAHATADDGTAVGEAMRMGRDRPSTREVELRRDDGAWRVARVAATGGV